MADVIYGWAPVSHQCINVVRSFVAHASSRPRSRSSSSSNGFSLDSGFEGDGRRLSGRPHLQSANPSSAIMIRIKVSGADKAPKSAKTRSQICIAKKLSALDIQSSAKLDAQGCVNAAGKLRQI